VVKRDAGQNGRCASVRARARAAAVAGRAGRAPRRPRGAGPCCGSAAPRSAPARRSAGAGVPDSSHPTRYASNRFRSTPPPSPRTTWTRLGLPPVLSGHVSSLPPVLSGHVSRAPRATVSGARRLADLHAHVCPARLKLRARAAPLALEGLREGSVLGRIPLVASIHLALALSEKLGEPNRSEENPKGPGGSLDLKRILL